MGAHLFIPLIDHTFQGHSVAAVDRRIGDIATG